MVEALWDPVFFRQGRQIRTVVAEGLCRLFQI